MEVKAKMGAKMKKGAIGIDAILPFISVIVVAAILIGVSQIVLDEFMQNVETSTVANDSINDSMYGLAEFGDWWDLIVIVLCASIILGLIFMALYVRGKGF